MIIFVKPNEFVKTENERLSILITRKVKVQFDLNFKVYKKGELINFMLGEMERYMKKHSMTVHVFKHEHCGYHSVSYLSHYGFWFEGKKPINFKRINDTHFDLVCELYDAFFNDPFIPLED